MNLDELAAQVEFSEDPKEIILKIFDNYKNGTIFVQYWINFMTMSYNYMQATPQGVCKDFIFRTLQLWYCEECWSQGEFFVSDLQFEWSIKWFLNVGKYFIFI